jgi:hypothetical protein
MERVAPLFRAHGSYERYALMASPALGEAKQMTNFFAGLEE